MSNFEIIFEDSFDDEISKLKKENAKLREENERLKVILRYSRPIGVTAEEFAEQLNKQNSEIEVNVDNYGRLAVKQKPKESISNLVICQDSYDSFSTPTIRDFIIDEEDDF